VVLTLYTVTTFKDKTARVSIRVDLGIGVVLVLDHLKSFYEMRCYAQAAVSTTLPLDPTAENAMRTKLRRQL
jgi:hypothetical protein